MSLQLIHGLEPLHETWQEFWSIAQPVAVGMLYEINIAIKRLRRIDAAVQHALVEAEGRVRLHLMSIMVVYGTDRAGRAGQKGA
jgi:hypothetical protein